MSITTDVNTQFAAERASQLDAARASQAAWDQRVKDGKLQNLGNGRFKVNDPGSWDNGEILVNRGGQILPQHMLDMTSGKAALYTMVPAWHGLGTVIPAGLSSIDAVLKAGHIDFEVAVIQGLYRWDDEIREAPDEFYSVRTDTGAKLGAVGKIFAPIQPREGFAFLQNLTDSGDVVWESAGATRGGARVFVSMRLPETVTIDAEGINDEIIPFVVAINPNDGQGCFQVVVTPWRPICGNTERFAVRDAYTRWAVRHTRNATAQIEAARRSLGLSLKYYSEFAAEETTLAQTSTTSDEFDQLCLDVQLLAEPGEEAANEAARKQMVTKYNQRRDALQARFALESGRVGQTAYAAERAITGYLDHDLARRGTNMAAARATAIIEGADDDKKSKAHKLLMLKTR